MLKKTVTYIDKDTKKEATTDCYFHLTEMEFVRFQSRYDERIEALVARIGNGNATKQEIIDFFEHLISSAYGRMKDDLFVKNADITGAFLADEPYSALMMRFLTTADGAQEAAEFFNAIVPESMIRRAEMLRSEEIEEERRQQGEEARQSFADGQQYPVSRPVPQDHLPSRRELREGDSRGHGIGG